MADETATENTAGNTAENTPTETAEVEDVLVEEVSIDGMCGVY